MKKILSILIALTMMFTLVQNKQMTYAEGTDTVTVTFDAKGGMPEPETKTISRGSTVAEPTAPTKEGWELIPGDMGGGFDGWYLDENYSNEFDFNTPVDKDIKLYARYNGRVEVHTYDKTNGAYLVGGTIGCENVEESVTDKPQYGNPWVAEGTPVTVTATPDTGYRFVGWAKDSATGTILSTDATYEFTFEQNPTTLYALFEEAVTLTLHASSIKGDDFVDPIEIEVSKGTTIAEALEQYKTGTTISTEIFKVDGYMDDGIRTPKPMSQYSDWWDLNDDNVYSSTIINENMDLYYPLFILINEAEATVEAPICGTETLTEEDGEEYWSWDEQTNPPTITIPSDVNYRIDEIYLPGYWIADKTGNKPFVGKFEGGKAYNAEVFIWPYYGYSFANDFTFKINGTDAYFIDFDYDFIDAMVEVTAVHNWSEWKTVKEPTITEDGLEKRVCSGCGKEETEVIPALGSYENTKGNNATWTKGSTESLEFVFKNNKDDTKTFGNFVGIKVDGDDVDEKDYTAEAGSVVINLKPSYLETLSVGKHTLTAIFEDGQSESTFTIVEKSTPQSRTYVTPKTGVE